MRQRSVEAGAPVLPLVPAVQDKVPGPAAERLCVPQPRRPVGLGQVGRQDPEAHVGRGVEADGVQGADAVAQGVGGHLSVQHVAGVATRGEAVGL